jgi:hypothetical protein
MNCPYCLSEVADEATVCKVCTRDIYLFKPMMAKLAELEKKLADIPNQEVYQERIAELEALIEKHEGRRLNSRGVKETVLDVLLFLVLPLMLLLGAHDIITVVYDTKMVYLRIISIVLPLPFGYFLFKGIKRNLMPWFLGAVFLAISAVIGMSWITSLVDQSSIFPQNAFEWREVLEYAASIAFSFLTGMLIGGIIYNQKHQRRASSVGPLMKLVLGIFGEGDLSPEKMHNLMKKVNEYGATVVALGTTAISIYTGLKHIL